MKALLLGLLSVGLLIAASVNVSGKWAVQAAPAAGGGTQQAQLMYLNLNQIGTVVRGQLVSSNPRSSSAASPIHTDVWDGKVEGDAITFYVWAGRDQVVKTYYKGVISGEQITFTVTGSAPSFNFRGELNTPAPSRTVVAKRSY
jgi:hypothetical protein